MNNAHPRSSIKDAVLEKIRRGEVHMRPRWQFVLKGVLVALGAVLVALALLYLVSFVFFAFGSRACGLSRALAGAGCARFS